MYCSAYSGLVYCNALYHWVCSVLSHYMLCTVELAVYCHTTCSVPLSLECIVTLHALYCLVCSVLSHYMLFTIELAVYCHTTCSVLLSLQCVVTLYALYCLVCSVLSHCVDLPFLQIPATNTCSIYHCPKWPAVHLNTENIALCSHEVLRKVIAWGLVDINVLDRCVITAVVVADVGWFALRMEAVDSSDTSASVTRVRVHVSQMTVMWRIKKLCLLLSE